jgi:hypothetical protein
MPDHEHVARRHLRRGGGAANRQVEATDSERDGHAHGKQRDDRRRLQDAEQVVHARERRLAPGEHDDQGNEQQHNARAFKLRANTHASARRSSRQRRLGWHGEFQAEFHAEFHTSRASVT